MAKKRPGPEPMPAAQLRARGSWHAKKKPKRERPTSAGLELGDGRYIEWARELEPLSIAGYSPADTAGDCTYDPVEAGRVLEFCERYVRHVKGELAGCGDDSRVRLEQWQAIILAHLFGWKRGENRRYSEMFCLIPRKNGKSFLGACISLYVLLCDAAPGAAGAEIYCAAASKDNARVIFDMCRSMAHAGPEIGARCKTMNNVIEYDAGQGDLRWLKPIPADASTQHGGNAQLAIVDEIHAQSSRHLYDVLRTSSGARPSGLFVTLTTSDFDRPSICNELRDYSRSILDGTVSDEAFFPVIYAAGPDDDYTDPDVWRAANPNFGISLQEKYIQAACKKAEAVPAALNTFLRLHLNVLTRTDEVFISLPIWDSCADGAARRVDPEQLRGEPCFVGIDLSAVSDLTAMALVFPRPDGSLKVIARHWIPKDKAMERDRMDHIPYLKWAAQDPPLIDLIPGKTIDQDVIERALYSYWDRMGGAYDIQAVAVDAWNAHGFALRLENSGLTVGLVSPTARGINASTKEFETAYLDRRLHHGGHELLRWQAGNCVVSEDSNGNIKPEKKKSAAKIDGVVAMILAVGLARATVKKRGSYYGQDAGVMVI